MKIFSVFMVAAMLFVVSLTTGCRPRTEEFEVAETPEDLFQQVIDTFNDISDMLESVTDQSSAETAAKELDDKYTPRIKAIGDRLQDIEDEIGVRAIDEIASQFEEPGMESMNRLFSQFDRLMEMDFDDLEASLESLEKAMDSF